jgi:hypothetical protein
MPVAPGGPGPAWGGAGACGGLRVGVRLPASGLQVQFGEPSLMWAGPARPSPVLGYSDQLIKA